MIACRGQIFTMLAVISGLLSGSPAFAQGDLTAGEAGALQRRMIQIAHEANSKTVCVLGLAGSGTGAVISGDGLVVTNAHVAAASSYAVLLFADGRKLLAKRQGIDYGRDLAFMKLVKKPSRPLPFFELAKRRPNFGSWIAAIGYPGGPKTNAAATFSIGVVRKGAGPGNVNGVLNYADAIVSDAPIFPGNSGGPMVDLRGHLAGINGAVNLQGTASYSIPVERVRERHKQLREGLIMLPGGQTIDSNKNLLARALFRLIDPMVKRMMDQRLKGTAPAQPKGPQGQTPKVANFVESDTLARRALKTPRNKQLISALKSAQLAANKALLRVVDDRGQTISFATIVQRRYAVTVASRIGNRRRVKLSGLGQGQVVMIDRGQNLALLKLPRAQSAPKWRWQAPVGTLVVSGGGLSVPGALSVQRRAVSARQALAMAQGGGGLPGPIAKAMERIGKLAKRLKIKSIQALIEQMLQSTEAREAYMRGSIPRGFQSVISHDSPLPPSQVGTPLMDRNGDLLAVNVSNAHFGTSYAVSIEDLVRAFPVLGGAQRPQGRRPERRRSQNRKEKAKLY
jgi:S1-C subfamily serine protease